jgi:ferredoxin
MSDDNSGIRITIVNVDTIPSVPQKTILESLEARNIQATFHCRDGFCGACRCKLLSGEVDYTVDPLAFIDDDEILPCCSVPLSDITIEME